MQRFGISTAKALGVKLPVLREVAKSYRKSHDLALQLWATDIHEARLLATMIDDPAQVTEEQMDEWTHDFYAWDLCDQACSNLFVRTPYAYQKTLQWSREESEFVKRAGFVMMAALAVHQKKAPDDLYLSFLLRIEEEAHDDRNFVKKAVNWALRQIGKRNVALNAAAITTAQRIQEQTHRSARWIAADALRELTGEKLQLRIKGK